MGQSPPVVIVPLYPQITVHVIGNFYPELNSAIAGLRSLNCSETEINCFIDSALFSSYNFFVTVCRHWFTVTGAVWLDQGR